MFSAPFSIVNMFGLMRVLSSNASGVRRIELDMFAACSSLAFSYPVGYNWFNGRPDDDTNKPINTINSTEEFNDWVDGLADLKARAAVYLRIKRAELGNFGEFKVLDGGVSEMKIDVGPGYRVYFARERRVVYLLLCGGDKSTQKADIRRAVKMWATIRKERT